MTLADNSAQYNSELFEPLPLPNIELPSDATIAEELQAPFALKKEHKEDFKRNGFVKLANVFTPGAVIRLRQEPVSYTHLRAHET